MLDTPTMDPLDQFSVSSVKTCRKQQDIEKSLLQRVWQIWKVKITGLIALPLRFDARMCKSSQIIVKLWSVVMYWICRSLLDTHVQITGSQQPLGSADVLCRYQLNGIRWPCCTVCQSLGLHLIALSSAIHYCPD